jgi:hypothetical protein
VCAVLVVVSAVVAGHTAVQGKHSDALGTLFVWREGEVRAVCVPAGCVVSESSR